MKFYRCNVCGKIVAVIKETDSKLICCNEPMSELVAGSIDAAKEKHVPKVEIKDNTVLVSVGEIEHPMTQEHLIEWVMVETENGNLFKKLKAGDKPFVSFSLPENEKAVNVYSYCNLHGLWKKSV